MRAKYVSLEVASARGIAARWERERVRDGKWVREGDEAICERLAALGSTPSISDAANIIGNKSWTYLSCAGCSEYIEIGVRMGSDYEPGKIYCAICIDEAHQTLKGVGK
jgi:hypothetical protein